MPTQYSDLPIPDNACHYRIATHTVKDNKGVEVKSRSYCRLLCEPGSPYCPKHKLIAQVKEDEKAFRAEKKAAKKRGDSVGVNA